VIRIGSVDERELRGRFDMAGVRLRLAGLCINVWTDVPTVMDQVLAMYVGHPVEAGTGVDDCRVRLSYTSAVRRFVKRKTVVSVNGELPFAPTPIRLAYLSVEAALNWCVHKCTPSYLVLHSAVVERGGLAVILPGSSSVGKSTLCAALVTRGWRLLSDELGVLRPDDFRLQPVVRPISLKNESIELIRQWAPDSYFGPVMTGTIRGDIAFLRPPAESVARAAETTLPALIVSPRYQSGATATLRELGKIETFRMLLDHAFNYHATQRAGFDSIMRLVETCPAYSLSYGTLREAVDAMEGLVARHRVGSAPARPVMAAT
jgi:HprK-related kinase A